MNERITRTLEEVPGLKAAILFGSTIRGDSGGGSDYDIALVVNGGGSTGYLTSEVIYEKLSLTRYDITFATTKELDGIISSFFKTPFTHHLSQGKLIYGDEDIFRKLTEKLDVWRKVQDLTGIPSEYLSDVSFMMNRARRGDRQIRRYLSQELLLGLEDTTASLKDRIKSCKSNVRSVITSGLMIKRYQEPDFGKEDLADKFTSEYSIKDFFEFRGRSLSFKDGVVEALFSDMTSDPSYVAITNKTCFCRQLVEAAAGAINKYICELVNR